MSHDFCDELKVTWIAVYWYDFFHTSFLLVKTSDGLTKLGLSMLIGAVKYLKQWLLKL